MKTITFGTVRVGETIVPPGTRCPASELAGNISLGDSGQIPENLINWIYYDGRFIADRSVLHGVSWNDIERSNLCFGKKIVIDGLPFGTRLVSSDPTVSMDEMGVFTIPSEWDLALSEPETSALWKEDQIEFWSEDITMVTSRLKTVRGGAVFRAQATRSMDLREGMGYRPVLVPECFNPKNIHKLIGRKVVLYGSMGFLIGFVNELTDYDIIVSQVELGKQGSSFCEDISARLPDGRVAVSREYATKIQPYLRKSELKA